MKKSSTLMLLEKLLMERRRSRIEHPPFPKRLFHGSPREFDVFSLDHFGRVDDGYYGIGIYLSTTAENANDYGWNLYECEVINPKPFYLWDSSTMGDDMQARVDLSKLPEYQHVLPDTSVPPGYRIRKRHDDGNGYRNPGKVYGVMPKPELYADQDVRYGEERAHPRDAVVAFNDDAKGQTIGGGWTQGLLKQVGRKGLAKVLQNNGFNCLVLYAEDGVHEVMVPDPACIRIKRRFKQKNKYDVYESEAYGAAFKVVTGFYGYHTTSADNLEDIQEEGLLTSSRSNEGSFSHGAIFFADYDQCAVLRDQIDDQEREGAAVMLTVWIPEGETIYADDYMPGGTSYCIGRDIPVEDIGIVDAGDPPPVGEVLIIDHLQPLSGLKESGYHMDISSRPGDISHFQDTNGVGGSVDISRPNVCVIYEFWSYKRGKGFAENALKHLKSEYGHVSVTDVGEPDEPSFLFWKHMLERGVINAVMDQQGKEHTSTSTLPV